MVFSSAGFLVLFLPIFLIVYHLAPKRLKNTIILLASIFFYSWGAPKFVFILLGSTFIDFYLVRYMHQTSESLKKRYLLAASIVLNVGLLLYFKYANFFIENVNILLQNAGFVAVSWTKVALPIGISFYTFQTLTYSIDIYRGVGKPLEKVTDYLLYILLFPQMIAGPIVRYNTIADEITGREESTDEKITGFYRFVLGLSKKILIANVLASQTQHILELGPDGWNTYIAWAGILAYTFQIYFDFSGYSDMAIGIGQMLGFHFPENFNNPYISGSITEFWRRWHMTLGAWMRDYLYIPLGGNRVKSKARLYFNLWFVFLISGIWHGDSWTFVLWGAFHGFFLILDRLFLAKVLAKIGKVPAVLFTFFVVMMSWVIFWIEDLNLAIQYYEVLFSWTTSVEYILKSNEFWTTIILGILFSFFLLLPYGKTVQQFFYARVHSLKTYYALSSAFILLYFMSLMYLTSGDFNPFLYFRF